MKVGANRVVHLASRVDIGRGSLMGSGVASVVRIWPAQLGAGRQALRSPVAAQIRRSTNVLAKLLRACAEPVS